LKAATALGRAYRAWVWVVATVSVPSFSFLAGATQVLRFGEDPLRDRDDRLAGLGDLHQALAMTHEDLDAELILEGADLLRNAGLRSMQRFRRFGHVQTPPGDLRHVAQLLQFHELTSEIALRRAL
jgi:hypothetical protein